MRAGEGTIGSQLRVVAMKRSLLEGPIYALMVGLGESYFIAAAVRLGASPLELGLVVGLPLAAGGLGSLAAIPLIELIARRKPVVVLAAASQASVLLALSALAASAQLSAGLIIVAAGIYHACGQASGIAWSSWFGDVVPEAERGRFFGRRNRAVYGATCAGLIVGGVLLQWLEDPAFVASSSAPLWGFALLFALAALARCVSVVLLARSPEARFSGLSGARRVARYLRTGRGEIAWRILLIGACLQLVTYLASPFFAPYMLDALRFTYVEYMTVTVAVVVGKSWVLPRWGRMLDEQGPRRVYALAAVLVALVPLPWLWARGLGWVLFAQLFSGVSWASYEVSYFTLLLDSSYRRTRPQVFAAQNLLNGTAQLLGSAGGALVLATVERRYVYVFALSLVLRLAVALAIPLLVPKLGIVPRTRRTLALRMIGLRPHGGPVHRVVLGPSQPEEGPDEPGTPPPRSH